MHALWKIKASDAVQALKTASDSGLTLDETYGAVLIDPTQNLYNVRGTATRPINDPNVKGPFSGGKIGTFGPRV